LLHRPAWSSRFAENLDPGNVFGAVAASGQQLGGLVHSATAGMLAI
jgi:hypothetical protein